MQVGIFTFTLGLGYPAGVEKAAELGAKGVQLWVNGELAPNLTDEQVNEVRERLARLHLTLSATCGEVGGFAEEDTWEERVELTKRLLRTSRRLGAPVMTGHIGVIPEDESRPEWGRIYEALVEIGRVAQEVGVRYAAETGPEHPVVQRRMLERVGNPYVGVNYDPANLAMRGFSPAGGVMVLREFIFHTHAKDGRQLGPGRAQELPLGEGDVCFPLYLRRLAEIGYTGFLTIERETGQDRVGDIGRAVEFLKKQLEALGG